jgi:hypothetical protein
VTFTSKLVANILVEVLQKHGFTAYLEQIYPQQPMIATQPPHDASISQNASPSVPPRQQQQEIRQAIPSRRLPSPSSDRKPSVGSIQARGDPHLRVLKPKKVVRSKAKAKVRGGLPPSRDPKGKRKAAQQLSLQQEVEVVDLVSPRPPILDFSEFDAWLLRDEQKLALLKAVWEYVSFPPYVFLLFALANIGLVTEGRWMEESYS